MEKNVEHEIERGVMIQEFIYGVYGDLKIIYPKPYSIYLRGDHNTKPKTLGFPLSEDAIVLMISTP